ncbi:MAG: hypothetical protein NVS2B12_16310 [Ktedonobacteraceae bacterium]
MPMEVEVTNEQVDVPGVVTALLSDFSTVTDYRMLRDSLPQRLASMLKCRSVLIYLYTNEALQLASSSFDDIPGWSSALLSVAHINPINIHSELPEARAWRERRAISQPARSPTLLALPLIYRQRCTGALVAVRGLHETETAYPAYWGEDNIQQLTAIAGVVALLMENVRLLEHDRDRIRELSLLNSISSQMNSATYETERLRAIILQRAREIAAVDLCDLLEPSTPVEAVSWIDPRLRERLLQRFQEQRSMQPLIIERSNDSHNSPGSDYFDLLPDSVKTFFAFPLFSGRTMSKQNGLVLRGTLNIAQEVAQVPIVLGYIVGVYHRPWKMGQVETALLRVLANQASAVLENMRLMEEVMKARNEARVLLHQVLDDQRMNALILESVPSGLITTDQNERIHTFNRAAEVILGYHHYEVAGQPLRKYLDLDLLATELSPASALSPAQQAFLAAMHTGEPQHQTMITVDRYDREIFLALDTRPLYDDGGKQVGLLIAFTDVTSMHRLEEEKRRLDRLASLGEMATNVAHEVRNPLASIKTSIQMLRNDLAQNEAATMKVSGDEKGGGVPAPGLHFDWAREAVAVILKEVERLDIIVHELLLFAKPRQLHRAQCTIQEVINHVLSVVEHQYSDANVEVHRVYEDVPPIWLDIDQIEQVLLNLCLNAIQAMPDGGILTIVCQQIPTEQAIYDTAGSECPPTQRPSGSLGTAAGAYAWLIDRHATQKESRVQHWLEIMVRDTGVGISDEQLKHIFQPFYTTKAHGIGLGLAISRRLIEDHGGYLRVESQFGYGSTIAIRLPFVTDDVMLRGVQQKDAAKD